MSRFMDENTPKKNIAIWQDFETPERVTEDFKALKLSSPIGKRARARGVDSIKKPKFTDAVQSRFSRDIGQLSMDSIASFLDTKDICTGCQCVSKSWSAAFDAEGVWQHIFAKRCLPRSFNGLCYSPSWRHLVQLQGIKNAEAMLSLAPSGTYIDLLPPSIYTFDPQAARSIPGATTRLCVEVLPGFYWMIVQLPTGPAHFGVPCIGGRVLREKGVPALTAMLQHWSSVGFYAKFIEPRPLMLLLLCLRLLPKGISLDTPQTNYELQLQPFSLRLNMASDALPIKRWSMVPGSKVCDDAGSSALMLSENESHAICTLTADEAGVLRWSLAASIAATKRHTVPRIPLSRLR